MLNKEAIKLLLEKALKECPKAQYKLGDFYYDEKNNVKLAFKWYKKAGENNHIVALYKLAKCYMFGMGTKINRDESFKYCKQSAEQGHKYAQFELATFYDEGIHCKCTIDKEKAYNWYIKSCEQGVVEAMYRIGLYHENNNNYSDAIKAYNVCAKREHIESYYKLGLYYKRLADEED